MKKKPQRINIKAIEGPDFVKNLSPAETDLLCADIRKELIRVTSLYGGHLSSNLGAVELTVAIHKSFSFPKDKLIFDVGHQCYTHKILTGRSLENLNSKGGISGFQKMKESEYDCYESGHSSNSLSAAEAFAIKRDALKENYNVIALIGDGSIVNGLSFEALNDISSRNHKVIIILNDNDMSISRPVGGMGNFFRSLALSKGYNNFKTKAKIRSTKSKISRGFYKFGSSIKNWIKSKLIPSTMFEDMGFAYIGVVDGHDIKDLCKAFEKAKKSSKSVVVHVHTKKGKGFALAENDTNGYWHGVAPFNIETGEPLDKHEDSITWSHLMSDFVTDSMENREDIYCVVPAMVKGSELDECFSKFPERTMDVGIAEEHALTLSGALSVNGYHPVVAVYSTFLQRAFDELSHDCARMKADMTILVDRAGLIGKYGETHQGIFDEAFLKAVPGVILTMPSNAEEAKALYEQSLEKGRGIFCIRFPRDYLKKGEIKPASLEFGKWLKIREETSKKAVCVSFGPHIRHLEALAKEENADFAIYNALYLSSMDEKAVEDIAEFENIVIYDPYGIKEGFAQSLMSALAERGYSGKIHVRTVPNAFVQHASITEQEEEYGLRPSQVFDLVKSL
ncbi:MAG: 1-deoxy-D-xylulose-5-phosphate synthase [Bacilli bacterium]|nr:1-deoxy-D-xylulose-5-phosphate synthase [Bacilli bacterium]